jgi:hypothetical protein
MERLPPPEPEFSIHERESAAVNGMAFALVAATGISLAIAAKIAHKQYKKAKKKAENLIKE